MSGHQLHQQCLQRGGPCGAGGGRSDLFRRRSVAFSRAVLTWPPLLITSCCYDSEPGRESDALSGAIFMSCEQISGFTASGLANSSTDGGDGV